MTVMMRARLGAASVRAGVPGRSTTRPTQLLYTRLYASVVPDDKKRDYMQWSDIPTMHFQKSLFRLPIPKLEKTCERYLKSMKALLTPEEYEETVTVVEKFKTVDAPVLHDKLVAHDKANKHTSYISGPWFDMYLRSRDPLPLNFNPFLGWHFDPVLERNDQVLRATALIQSLCRFHNSLRINRLVPDVFHRKPHLTSDSSWWSTAVSYLPEAVALYGAAVFQAFPLDMSQYKNLFGSTRIPRQTKDDLLIADDPSHIAVQFRNRFYKLEVVDRETRQIRSTGDIKHALKNLMASAVPAKDKDDEAVGIFTTLERNRWATLREQLLSAGNQASLDAVDSALFCLSLDEQGADYDQDNIDHRQATCRTGLHGDGKNRWFDKSFSVYVMANGMAMLNFEHSWGDGVAVLRTFDDVYNDSIKLDLDTPASSSDPLETAPIDFKLTTELKKEVLAATAEFAATTANLDLDILESFGNGKNFAKRVKISPDGFAQLGMQLGYRRMHGKNCNVYESATTAAFKHGRTEAARPLTLEAKRFLDTFENASATVEEKRKALRDAAKAHSTISVEGNMGQGFDRHLISLKFTAEKEGLPVPEFFNHFSYARLNENVLSTSTLISPAVLLGGFGHVCPHGFGIGYNMDGERFGTVTTTYEKDNAAKKFLGLVQASLLEMAQVLESDPELAKK